MSDQKSIIVKLQKNNYIHFPLAEHLPTYVLVLPTYVGTYLPYISYYLPRLAASLKGSFYVYNTFGFVLHNFQANPSKILQ